MQRTNTFELARYGADLQRRMHDMPIGDPMSGAPYGEHLKSKGLGMVIGVVASVVTMGAAAPLMASTLLATQIAGGVMMAGGVLSGVGAVTGNKKLAKIGGVMSLAGGIGAAASGLTGGLGLGSGAGTGVGDALKSVGTSFMESANSITGGLGMGEIYGGVGKGATEAVKTAGEMSLGNTDDAGLINNAMKNAEPITAPSELPTAEALGAEPGATGAEPGTIDGKNAVTQQGASNATITLDQAPGAQVPAASATNTPIDPANLNNGPNPGKGFGGFADNPAKEPGIIERGLKFAKDNSELLKIGAGGVESFMKYGMGGDTAEAQAAYYQAAAAKSGAETAYLTTKNDELKWQMENQNKKSIMLSADDPMLEQKMAQAKAEGTVVGVIPTIGAGGVKQTGPTAFSTAQAGAGQQVVRQPTFNAPTPQRAA